jgi:glycosyltransferase involved in cell wall biosynthesis
MKIVSIVIPVFNEEENIENIHQAIVDIFSKLSNLQYEIIFINDGSSDNSLQILKLLSKRDTRVKIISFTRNFGHQAAITAGLKHSKGNATITMDCDFQDPPEVIDKMIRKWEEGSKVVYAKRTIRKDKFMKKTTALIHYKILSFSSEVKMPANIGDFRLMDKQLLDVIRENNMNTDYIRGILPWLGFSYSIVEYERPDRISGKTGFSWLKMLRFALKGMLSFSIIPLRLGLFVGLFVIFSSFIFLAYLMYNFIFNNEFYKLLEWLAAFNYMLLGFLFVLIWILAEYIFNISNKVKGIPMYVIDETIHIDNK